jgi:hypothetical protein
MKSKRFRICSSFSRRLVRRFVLFEVKIDVGINIIMTPVELFHVFLFPCSCVRKMRTTAERSETLHHKNLINSIAFIRHVVPAQEGAQRHRRVLPEYQ